MICPDCKHVMEVSSIAGQTYDSHSRTKVVVYQCVICRARTRVDISVLKHSPLTKEQLEKVRNRNI